jgi:hypothetical protein
MSCPLPLPYPDLMMMRKTMMRYLRMMAMTCADLLPLATAAVCDGDLAVFQCYCHVILTLLDVMALIELTFKLKQCHIVGEEARIHPRQPYFFSPIPLLRLSYSSFGGSTIIRIRSNHCILPWHCCFSHSCCFHINDWYYFFADAFPLAPFAPTLAPPFANFFAMMQFMLE